MKIRKRFMSLFVLLFALLCVVGAGKVQAATSYKALDLYKSSQKVGNTTFVVKELSDEESSNRLSVYAKKNGKKTLLIKKTYEDSIVVTNGSTVYFQKGHSYYKVKVDGTSKEKLFSVKSYSHLVGYYNGKLYFVKESGLGHYYLYSYSMKSGKKTKVRKEDLDGYSGQETWMDGKYIYLEYVTNNTYRDMHTVGLGLKVYNCSTKKVKTITTKLHAYAVLSGKVYYVEYKSNSDIKKSNAGYTEFNVSVKCYNPKTGNTKTKLKSLKLYDTDGLEKIYRTKITYWDKNYKKLKTKKYQ